MIEQLPRQKEKEREDVVFPQILCMAGGKRSASLEIMLRPESDSTRLPLLGEEENWSTPPLQMLPPPSHITRRFDS
ncbi:hypothetical protein NPIL_316641 [Nephila pilipes]|uniref:Uncharacterized protein n=1 Tax=Nephila pilipes TaxID=299642 RepID=A0A8X6ULP0_NEPPI|nr:hypothetical protein NPIL_316641 [Nephila pilipes]